MPRESSPAKIISLVNDECRCPLINTYEALNDLQHDEVLEVITDDIEQATGAIPKFCLTRNCPADVREDNGLWHIKIKKDDRAFEKNIAKKTHLLDIQNVAKWFKTKDGRFEALSPINLSIHQGEFICIVGPSGCGKSTLLNLIAGLDKPDDGKLILSGKEISGPDSDRVVIFQDLALFPWLNVIQNVEFGLKVKGLPTKERRIRALELLQLVHLLKFESHFLHELSGGMRQRVALARALAIEPKILLMDEPFSALDAQTRHLLHLELQEVWLATQKTIFFVTHNVREAVSLADRIIVMSASPGKIKKEYRIDLKRPREDNDGKVSRITQEILNELKDEIDMVTKREYGEI